MMKLNNMNTKLVKYGMTTSPLCGMLLTTGCDESNDDAPASSFQASFASFNKTSNYGSSFAVAKDGSVVVVGAATDDLYCPKDIEADPTTCFPEQNDSGFISHGSAYVYHPTTKKAWIIKPKQDVAFEAKFGTSVAVSGDGSLIAVSAVGDEKGSLGGSNSCHGIIAVGDMPSNCTANISNSDRGAVYVYAYKDSAWEQIYYVYTDHADTGDMNGYEFGTKLMWSNDGTTLVVGMPSDKNNNYSSHTQPTAIGTETTAPGSIYVYKYDSADGSLTFDYYYQHSGATALGKSMHATDDGVVVNADQHVMLVKLKTASSHNVTELTGLPTLPAGVTISEASFQDNQLAIGLPKLSSSCKGITMFNADTTLADCLNDGNTIQESGGVMVFDVASDAVTATALISHETSLTEAHMGQSLTVSTDKKSMFVGVSDHNDCVNIHGSRQDCAKEVGNLNNYGAIGHYTFEGTTWTETSYIKAFKNVPNAEMGVLGSIYQTDADLYFLTHHISSCPGIQDSETIGSCQAENGYRGVLLQYHYNGNSP
jgi:hypothetical protein